MSSTVPLARPLILIFLYHAFAAVAQAGADAVGAGVAAADHDHVLALGVERGDGAVEMMVELIAGVVR